MIPWNKATDIHGFEKGVKRKNKAEYESKEEKFERNLALMDESFQQARGPLGGGTYAVSG